MQQCPLVRLSYNVHTFFFIKAESILWAAKLIDISTPTKNIYIEARFFEPILIVIAIDSSHGPIDQRIPPFVLGL